MASIRIHRRHLASALVVPVLLVACQAGATSPTATPTPVAEAVSPSSGDPEPSPTGTPDDNALTAMTFMAGFQPQANLPFVGAYVAKERGMFAERGLDVEITHSGGGGEHLQLLTADRVQVTTQDAAVLLERRADPGLPLVSLALMGQTGQQAFVALADSGIETPSDWAGRTVGFKGTPPPDLFAILDAVGLEESDVDLVNVGFDPRVLTEGQVDVYPVYTSNEPDTLASWGFDLNQWEAAEYGVPTLGLTYVATEEMVTTRPEVLDAFIDGAMEGVEWARAHPDAAIDIVLTWTGSDADREHQRFILDTELRDAQSSVTDDHGLGWQTATQWQDLQDLLVDYDALSSPVDVEAVFTTQFLQ